MQDMEKHTENTIVYLIGMGPGRADCLTAEACAALRDSTVWIGAGRMLAIGQAAAAMDVELLDEAVQSDTDRNEAHRSATGTYAKRPVAGYRAYQPDAITEIVRRHVGEYIAVLFSGDIGFYSGAAKLEAALRRRLAGCSDQVTSDCIQIHRIPGISAGIYLLDKMGSSWENAIFVSNHGVTDNIPAKVLHHGKVCTLLGEESQVSDICTRLAEVGLADIQVTVGERLSYPDERIVSGSAEKMCGQSFNRLAVALFENPNPVPRRGAPGIPDNAFVRGQVPMTKEEVRTVVISKLRITDETVKPNNRYATHPVVYDIGAGTGSISVEIALLLEHGCVYAIEKNAEALELLKENRRRFHVGNMEIVAGNAPEVLADLPAPTHVFIGGSSGRLPEIVRTIMEKNPLVRLVVTAVTWETQAQLLELAEYAKQHDRTCELLQMAVTRANPVGAYHMNRAENPVWIAVV